MEHDKEFKERLYCNGYKQLTKIVASEIEVFQYKKLRHSLHNYRLINIKL